MFSLATVVGKSLQVDLATQNKTRLSCVKVKVEVDLLGDSKRINMGMKMKNGKIKEKSINIRYDYMPKHIARFASCRATIRRNALLFIQNCIQKRRKIIKVRRPIKIKKTQQTSSRRGKERNKRKKIKKAPLKKEGVLKNKGGGDLTAEEDNNKDEDMNRTHDLI